MFVFESCFDLLVSGVWDKCSLVGIVICIGMDNEFIGMFVISKGQFELLKDCVSDKADLH